MSFEDRRVDRFIELMREFDNKSVAGKVSTVVEVAGIAITVGAVSAVKHPVKFAKFVIRRK